MRQKANPVPFRSFYRQLTPQNGFQYMNEKTGADFRISRGSEHRVSPMEVLKNYKLQVDRGVHPHPPPSLTC